MKGLHLKLLGLISYRKSAIALVYGKFQSLYFLCLLCLTLYIFLKKYSGHYTGQRIGHSGITPFLSYRIKPLSFIFLQFGCNLDFMRERRSVLVHPVECHEIFGWLVNDLISRVLRHSKFSWRTSYSEPRWWEGPGNKNARPHGVP